MSADVITLTQPLPTSFFLILF